MDSGKLNRLHEQSNKKISLVTHGFSGSNSVALFKYVTSKKFKEVEYRLISQYDYQKDIEFLSSSKIVFTTFAPLKFTKEQVVIQSWHGFPLKTLGLLDKKDEQNRAYLLNMTQNSDIVLSYSTFYSTIFNSCFPFTYEYYEITGMPRNDFLFLDRATAIRNISKIAGLKEHDLLATRLIFYAPSYRVTNYRTDGKELGDTIQKTFFSEEFINFIDKNNYFVVIKLHPFEDFKAFKLRENLKTNRITFITNADLEQNFTDFYELLPAGDILITDYSSIYFDWLLTGKPVIFFLPDADIYAELRNFLLEPLDIWMPGPMCRNLHELLNSIERVTDGGGEYFENREFVVNTVHAFKDNKSSERVWKLIEQIFNNSKELPKSRMVLKNGEFVPVNSISYEYLQSMLSEGRFKEIIELLTEKSRPTEYHHFLALAISYANLDCKEQALEYIKEAQKRNPEDGEVLANLAEILYLNDKLSEAAEVALRAIDIRVNDAYLYDILHDWMLNIGEEELAYAFAELAIESCTTDEVKNEFIAKYNFKKKKRKSIIVLGELVNPELLYALTKTGFELVVPYNSMEDFSERVFLRSIGATMFPHMDLDEVLEQKDISVIICFGNLPPKEASTKELAKAIRNMQNFEKISKFAKRRNKRIVTIFAFNSKASTFEDRELNNIFSKKISLADFVIFPTENMKQYFESRFPQLKAVPKKVFIVDGYLESEAPEVDDTINSKFTLSFSDNIAFPNPLPRLNYGTMPFDPYKSNLTSFWLKRQALVELTKQTRRFSFGLGSFQGFYDSSINMRDILNGEIRLLENRAALINQIVNVPQDILTYLYLGIIPIIPDNGNDFYEALKTNGMAIAITKDCEYLDPMDISNDVVINMRRSIKEKANIYTVQNFLVFIKNLVQ
ncbi:CDP-glycerol glycerophosphotransferase family protein [Fervidobacterium sp.]